MVLFLRDYAPKLWQNIQLRTGESACQTLKNKTIDNKAHRYRLEKIRWDRPLKKEPPTGHMAITTFKVPIYLMRSL
jgi:hypothetical protein